MKRGHLCFLLKFACPTRHIEQVHFLTTMNYCYQSTETNIPRCVGMWLLPQKAWPYCARKFQTKTQDPQRLPCIIGICQELLTIQEEITKSIKMRKKILYYSCSLTPPLASTMLSQEGSIGMTKGEGGCPTFWSSCINWLSASVL